MSKRFFMIGGLIAATGILVLWLLPLPAELSGSGIPENATVTDRNGNVLYEIQGSGLRSETPLESIPQIAIDALIATEDRTFYRHLGLSLRGIIRAAWHDLKAGRIVEGGSTITQQLVRTLLNPPRRNVLYKTKEAWLALKLDARFAKHDILERYLNASYFGQGAYGIKAAARTYFDADVSALSPAQTALLIGLLNAPSSLNPFKDPGSAKARRDLVMRAMLDQSVMTAEEMQSASEEPVTLSSGKTSIRAPHFVISLLAAHPEFRSARETRTTIDLSLQTVVENIVEDQIRTLAEKNVISAAVVVLNAQNGDILSMVGSHDYFDAENDGAVNIALAARQPGSAVKPFTYALALSQGMTVASTVSDVQSQFFTQDGNPYTPRNYDYLDHGLVRLREALGNSYNIAAVKVMQHVGVDRLLVFLKAAGITTLDKSPEHYGLALTLGDAEVKLLELTSAYGVFARGGQTLQPRWLIAEAPLPGKTILDPKVAWLIADILSDPDARTAEFGREGPLNFDFPVAAKTGTTRNSRDNWTIGFTQDVIVGVWVGNADNSPMKGTSGVTGAGPIFHDVMLAATERSTRTGFSRPAGIIDREICRLSGKLPTDLCIDRITEHFIAGTEPRDPDDIYVEKKIDSRNGLLAGESCPPAFVRSERFTSFPPELKKWARESGWKEPPALVSPLCTGGVTTATGSITIVRPAPRASYLMDPLIPDEHENIIFEARAPVGIEKLDWYVNGKKAGQGSAPDFRMKWSPALGSFTVQAGTGASADMINFRVEK